MEAAPGIEPGIRALQAPALPLGYAASDQEGSSSIARSFELEKVLGRSVTVNETRPVPDAFRLGFVFYIRT